MKEGRQLKASRMVRDYTELKITNKSWWYNQLVQIPCELARLVHNIAKHCKAAFSYHDYAIALRHDVRS